jgi:hypothetical protein
VWLQPAARHRLECKDAHALYTYTVAHTHARDVRVEDELEILDDPDTEWPGTPEGRLRRILHELCVAGRLTRAFASISTSCPTPPTVCEKKLSGNMTVSNSSERMRRSAAASSWAEKPIARTLPWLRASLTASSAPPSAHSGRRRVSGSGIAGTRRLMRAGVARRLGRAGVSVSVSRALQDLVDVIVRGHGVKLEEVKVGRLQHLEAVLHLRNRRGGAFAELARLAAQKELLPVRREGRAQQPLRVAAAVRRGDVDVGAADFDRLLHGGGAQRSALLVRGALAAHVLGEAEAAEADDGEVVAEALAAAGRSA